MKMRSALSFKATCRIFAEGVLKHTMNSGGTMSSSAVLLHGLLHQRIKQEISDVVHQRRRSNTRCRS